MSFASYYVFMPSLTNLAYALQQALNAAPLAALYALLAFGYAITFGLTRRADFTPGALFAFAGQVFVFFTAFAWNTLWLVYPAALAVGAAAGLVYGLLAGAVIGARLMGPLTRAAPNAVITASLAVMIVLMEIVRIAADSRDLWLSPFLNRRLVLWPHPTFSVSVTAIQLANTLIMSALVGLGALVLARSRFGRNWRACADDRLAAELMGVNTARILVLSGAATALCSASAGLFASAYYGSMDFGSGLMFGLKVVMIAAVGDQTSPPKSALGAAIFGVVETFWGAYVSFVWRDLAMFSMLILLAVLLRRERFSDA